jgi:glycosyltransferase involved in cell wall biosynthesis
MNIPRVLVLRGRETDPAILKYCRALSKNNYDVKLLIWNRRGNITDLPTETERFTQEHFFFRAPLDKFSAVFFYPVWWIYIMWFLIKEKSDIVHSCDFDTLIPVMVLRKFRKFKFVYTIFDFYANNIQDGNFSPVRRGLKKFVKTIDFWGINSSDLLILADESRVEEIQGTKVNNLIFIYNTPEDQQPAALPGIKNSGARVSIFFAGLLMNFRGIKDMIKAVSSVPDVKLTLAGPLIDTDLLEGIPAHSDRISYIGWIPSYQEVLDRTISSDILFRFSDPKHPKTRYESPNKLFEAMMCAKPIIVSDQSAMAAIVRKSNCGLVVPYGDIEAIKVAIQKLKNDSNLRHELGMNGRKAYDETYSWRIMEHRLLAGYKTIYP